MSGETGEPEFFPSAIYRDERDPGTWRENWVYKLASGEVVAIYNDITERKRGENALRESEERYQSILNASPDGIAITDIEGRLLMVSPAVLNIFAYERQEELLGHTFSNFIVPEDHERAAANVALMFQGTMTGPGEYRGLRADGSTFAIEVNGEFVRGTEGQPTQIVFIVRDISGRKQAEVALLESENKYRELVENHNDVIFSVDAVGKIQYISPAITGITGYTQEEVTARNLFDFFSPEERDRYAAQMQQTMEGGSSIGEFLITVKDRSSKWIRASSKCVVENGKVTGIRGIMSDISERKQAEKEKEQIISLQKATIESTADGILVITHSGKIMDFNQRFAKMWHIPDSILETRDDAQLLRFVLEQVLDPQEFLAKVNEVYAAPERESFDLLQFKDGRCFERYSRPQLISGRPVGRVWSFRDISARKQAESQREAALAALNESKERYENFISQISDGVYRFEPDEPMPLTLPVEEQIDFIYRHMFIAECNPSLMDMYGIKEPGDILGKTQMDFHGGSDNPVNRQAMRDFIQSGYRTHNVVTKEIDIHGNNKYFSNNTIGIIKDNHLVRMWGTQTDISEQRRVQEALRESEERFRSLYENSSLGLYRTTPDGRIHLANPALIRMLGYPSFAELAKIDLQRDGFTPSHSRVRFIENIEKNGEVKALEYVWKRNDGTTIIVRESARAIRNDQGKTLYYDGIVEDISELKRAETKMDAALEALRKSEEQYRALVENASDIVFRANNNGYFTFANPAAIRMIGYEREELIGKLYLTLISPDMREKVYNLFVLQRTQRIQNTYLEYLVLTKDGHHIWLGQNTQLIFENGQMTGFQAVARDITEIKQAEAEIKRQLAEKETLLREVHHRIKNNIASIGGLISLRLQAITNPEAAAVLQDALGRIDSMRILYDKLLLSEGYKDIPVKTYVESLATAMVSLYPEQAKVKLEMRIADFQLDAKRLFPLGLIINELLTNKMKYAFIDRKTGSIKIDLSRKDNHVNLVIEDNGKGLPAGFDINKTKGFGLMLVKMLSQQLGASFYMEQSKGTRCTLEFDI